MAVMIPLLLLYPVLGTYFQLIFITKNQYWGNNLLMLSLR